MDNPDLVQAAIEAGEALLRTIEVVPRDGISRCPYCKGSMASYEARHLGNCSDCEPDYD